MPSRRPRPLAAALLLAAACGGTESDSTPPYDPYSGAPPLGAAIDPETEAAPILDGGGGDTGWTWVDFPDSTCNDAEIVGGAYSFSESATGLAIRWGAGDALVVFLQGGGACWDFVTCGGAYPLSDWFCAVDEPGCLGPTATVGPFGPAEFRAEVLDAFPNGWLLPGNLPPELADATLVFVPYCTGDIHGGDRETTYTSPPELAAFDLPPVTWSHRGHANLMAFLQRLGATFPAPSKLVVAGSSAGGFGALANYPAFRWYWPGAEAFLVDDSAPPLIGEAIPASTRAAWYSSWDLGVSLDAYCTGCRADMSQGLAELATRYPSDRIALLSTLQDGVIRAFFGTFSDSPPYFVEKPAETFEAELRALGAQIALTTTVKYFFTDKPTIDDHPLLDDPTVVTTPAPGLEAWLARMVSSDPDVAATWTSVEDP